MVKLSGCTALKMVALVLCMAAVDGMLLPGILLGLRGRCRRLFTVLLEILNLMLG
jgi:hypothetical protein